MKIDNIIELFENYSLQAKEEIILGSIINCKNTVNKLPVFKDMNQTKTSNIGLVNLFESVSGINISNQSNFFNNNNVLSIEDYHNNPYVYLKDVNELVESHIPTFSLVQQNDEIKNFSLSIQSYISHLEKINDIELFDKLNENVIKTKLFAKKPIYVYGVNLFEIEKIKEHIQFHELYSIIYNKSYKQLMFIGDKKIITYDIKSDKLDENHLINIDMPALVIDKTNYLEYIKEEITNNFIAIYTNQELIKPLKFSDNLYGDVKRLNDHNMLMEIKKKNSSVIK